MGGVLARPLTTTPGTDFNYNSGAFHLLSAIITRACGPTAEFAVQHLFEPLGITSRTWELDRQRIANGAAGLQVSTNEMAALGQLILDRGRVHHADRASGVPRRDDERASRDPRRHRTAGVWLRHVDRIGSARLVRARAGVRRAINARNLAPINWGQGLWHRVQQVYGWRKGYVHVPSAVNQAQLVPALSEAEDAVVILRDAIKDIVIRTGATPPQWVVDDGDVGWEPPDPVRGFSRARSAV